MSAETEPANTGGRIEFLGLPFDLLAEKEVLDRLKSVSAPTEARYIVTPNVDHIVRASKEPSLKPYYDDAWLSLCDSKPVYLFAKLSSTPLTHVTGSDLTTKIFSEVIKPGDTISIVAAYESVAESLAEKFPDVRFRSLVPPFGVLTNPQAQKEIVDFLAAEPSRFVFIAIGSPQSELIARQFSQRPGASGVALCIGASLEFIVGTQQRAPRWMRLLVLEWLHRLLSDPRRLWRRYLTSVVPLTKLFIKELKTPSRQPVKPEPR